MFGCWWIQLHRHFLCVPQTDREWNCFCLRHECHMAPLNLLQLPQDWFYSVNFPSMFSSASGMVNVQATSFCPRHDLTQSLVHMVFFWFRYGLTQWVMTFSSNWLEQGLTQSCSASFLAWGTVWLSRFSSSIFLPESWQSNLLKE